jgi:hypothetical protein
MDHSSSSPARKSSIWSFHFRLFRRHSRGIFDFPCVYAHKIIASSILQTMQFVCVSPRMAVEPKPIRGCWCRPHYIRAALLSLQYTALRCCATLRVALGVRWLRAWKRSFAICVAPAASCAARPPRDNGEKSGANEKAAKRSRSDDSPASRAWLPAPGGTAQRKRRNSIS